MYSYNKVRKCNYFLTFFNVYLLLRERERERECVCVCMYVCAGEGQREGDRIQTRLQTLSC